MLKYGDIVEINDPENKVWHGYRGVIDGICDETYFIFVINYPFWTYQCSFYNSDEKLIKIDSEKF